MLLKEDFGVPELNLALEVFLRDTVSLPERRIVSVTLYGSIIEGDLSPGYGDLDFLAITDDNLTADDCMRLRTLRSHLRSGRWGRFAHMLEGAFLPRQMLNPETHGRACWWGTSSERTWSSNRLGAFCLRQIKTSGLPIYGADLRPEVPLPSPEELTAEAEQACADIQIHGTGGGLMSIDWLFLASRVLHWAETGCTCSKSEAANWAYVHATGEWRSALPRAVHLRKHPELAHEPATVAWLSNLTERILAAGEEASKAVRAMGD